MPDGPPGHLVYEVPVKFTLTFDTGSVVGAIFASASDEDREAIAAMAVAESFKILKQFDPNRDKPQPFLVITPSDLPGAED